MPCLVVLGLKVFGYCFCWASYFPFRSSTPLPSAPLPIPMSLSAVVYYFKYSTVVPLDLFVPSALCPTEQSEFPSTGKKLGCLVEHPVESAVCLPA